MNNAQRNRLSLGTRLGPAVLLAVLVCACGGGGKNPPATDLTQGSDWEVRVSTGGDTTLVTGPGASAGVEDTTAAPTVTAAPADTLPPPESKPVSVPDPRDFTPGWRVQIAAVSSMASADAKRREAMTKITEPVYVEYEPPFYKVRVGDFLTKKEAQSMATRLKAEGFETFVVETLVLKPSN
jgi:cell division protein FtsN